MADKVQADRLVAGRALPVTLIRHQRSRRGSHRWRDYAPADEIECRAECNLVIQGPLEPSRKAECSRQARTSILTLPTPAPMIPILLAAPRERSSTRLP